MHISMVTGIALISTNRQKLGLNLTIASIAVNVSLNVLMIPKYSHFGASFATVVTEAFGLALALFFRSTNALARLLVEFGFWHLETSY